MTPAQTIDSRFMAAAIALADRGTGLTAPNPAVGCVIVQGGIVVGRGWTQAGGRPHAEFVALMQAGSAARGATLYTTLEPCAHVSVRGPCCADEIIAAGVARVVVALGDPDPRTAGQGLARLEAAGVQVRPGVGEANALAGLRSHFLRVRASRASVTLKVATSLDGFVADAAGTSRWITGPRARAHAALQRARHNAILVGAGTVRADDPALDVRLPGLEHRSPVPIVISHTALPPAARLAANPRTCVMAMADPLALLHELAREGILSVLVEGGPAIAAQFLEADLVDQLHWYRAPVLLGQGLAMSSAMAQHPLEHAHDTWHCTETSMLGADTFSAYTRTRKED